MNFAMCESFPGGRQEEFVVSNCRLAPREARTILMLDLLGIKGILWACELSGFQVLEQKEAHLGVCVLIVCGQLATVVIVRVVQADCFCVSHEYSSLWHEHLLMTSY